MTEARLWKFKDDSKWWNGLPVAKRKIGNVLIQKLYEGGGPTSRRRRLGMQILSKVEKGSGSSQHASIDIGNLKRGFDLAEIESKAMWTSFRRVERYPHVVWSCNKPAIAIEAALIANALVYYEVNDVFPIEKATRSVVRMRYAGKKASRLLSHLRDVLDQNVLYSDPAPKVPKLTVDMFCAEFVVACYELASEKKEGAPIFDVDPQAISPKALERLLNCSPHFTLEGRAGGTAAP